MTTLAIWLGAESAKAQPLKGRPGLYFDQAAHRWKHTPDPDPVLGRVLNPHLEAKATRRNRVREGLQQGVLEFADDRSQRHAIVIPDASEPGRWRFSEYDEHGFAGHRTFDTRDQAADAAADDGFHHHAPGSLDRLSRTDTWARGTRDTKMRQTAGDLSWAGHRDAARHAEDHYFRHGASQEALDRIHRPDVLASLRRGELHPELAKALGSVGPLGWARLHIEIAKAVQLGLFGGEHAHKPRAPARRPSGDPSRGGKLQARQIVGSDGVTRTHWVRREEVQHDAQLTLTDAPAPNHAAADLHDARALRHRVLADVAEFTAPEAGGGDQAARLHHDAANAHETAAALHRRGAADAELASHEAEAASGATRRAKAGEGEAYATQDAILHHDERAIIHSRVGYTELLHNADRELGARLREAHQDATEAHLDAAAAHRSGADDAAALTAAANAASERAVQMARAPQAEPSEADPREAELAENQRRSGVRFRGDRDHIELDLGDHPTRPGVHVFRRGEPAWLSRRGPNGPEHVPITIQGISHGGKPPGYSMYERSPPQLRDEHGTWHDVHEVTTAAEGRERYGLTHPSEQPAAPARPTERLSDAVARANAKNAEPGALAQHRDVMGRLRTGDITADELRAAFEQHLAGRDALRAELDRDPATGKKRTKAELLKFAHNGWAVKDLKRDDLVDRLVREHAEDYLPTGSYGWSPFNETQEEALRRSIGKLTDADIAASVQRRAENRSWLEEQLAKRKQALTAPETLDDFRQLEKARGRDAMSLDQRARYDHLAASAARKEREAERTAAAPPAAPIATPGAATDLAEVIPGTHTKHGHPIFTVRLKQRLGDDDFKRLKALAKQVARPGDHPSGYYSSFRGRGAVPGFIFGSQDEAHAFVRGIGGDAPAPEAAPPAEAPAEDRMARRLAHLRTVAERTHEAARQTLDADRKVNTARRAAMAASVEADARRAQQIAQSAHNVADWIEAGEAEHLAGVHKRSHVEALEGLLRSARYDHIRHEAKQRFGERGDYSWETAQRGRPATVEDVEHATFPWPTLNGSQVRSLVNAFDALPARAQQGAKRAATALRKLPPEYANGNAMLHAFDTEAKIGDLNRVVRALRDAGGGGTWTTNIAADELRDWRRMLAMDVHGPAEMRAALREYLKVRATTAKADPVVEAQRALVGQKFPSYFPTPKSLAREVIDRAGIRPGHSVLEPSAGTGHLADAARDAGGQVTAIERWSELRKVLELKGHQVAGNDALAHQGKHDRIVMNPPFENGQDMEHVRHAFEHNLQDGGRLVSIMGEGAFFRSDRKAQAFRDWLASVGGRSERLPAGSFKDSDVPTGVATRIVTIDKPGEAAKAGPRPGRRFLVRITRSAA